MTLPNKDDRRNWHLDKSISVSHLLTTLTLGVGGAWYVMGMQSQIDIGRQQNEHTQQQIQQVQQNLGEGNGPLRRDIDRIQTDLSRLNDKIDRLNEKLETKPRYLKDYR